MGSFVAVLIAAHQISTLRHRYKGIHGPAIQAEDR
jgi:hypothetical protein